MGQRWFICPDWSRPTGVYNPHPSISLRFTAFKVEPEVERPTAQNKPPGTFQIQASTHTLIYFNRATHSQFNKYSFSSGIQIESIRVFRL